MIETMQITFDQNDDGGWRATYGDLYNCSGHGETRYEALVELVEKLEDVFDEDED